MNGFISFKFLIFVFFCHFGNGEKINYSGYKVVRVFPQGVDQWKEVRSLENLGVKLVAGNRKYADLLLAPHLTDLPQSLKGAGYILSPVFDDVQSVIDSHKVNQEEIINGTLTWDRYYRLADIHQFLDDQAATHNTIASTQSIGSSLESREMKIIKISKSGETKPAVWIDAQIHAREWITGAVCTFIIDQLLNSNDTEIQSWLDQYDFYILPVLNVDGFEYSHTTDRFWRKSRLPVNNSLCIGTDLNRNFDFHWLGTTSKTGAHLLIHATILMPDPKCFLMLSLVTSEISSRLVFYLSLHSAGQYILIPTGFNSDRIPQYNTYMKIGNLAAEAHKQKFGTIFTPGSVYDEMYTATGSSMDWVKDKLKTNLTITYELRDKGQYGHLLPPEQIYPSCLEFMDGMKVLMAELSKGIPEVDP